MKMNEDYFIKRHNDIEWSLNIFVYRQNIDGLSHFFIIIFISHILLFENGKIIFFIEHEDIYRNCFMV